VDDRPETLGNVVAGQPGVARDSPPSQEDTQGRRPKIGGHADEVTHEADLGFTNLRHGIAKVVVGRHGKDVDPFAVGQGTQLQAARRRPIERIAMWPFAINLYPIVAIFFGSKNHVGERQRFTAVPEPQIRDAV